MRLGTMREITLVALVGTAAALAFACSSHTFSSSSRSRDGGADGGRHPEAGRGGEAPDGGALLEDGAATEKAHAHHDLRGDTGHVHLVDGLLATDVEGLEAKVVGGMSVALASNRIGAIICETVWDSPAHAALCAAGFAPRTLDEVGSLSNILYVRRGEGR